MHIAGLLDTADAGEVSHAGRAMNGLGDRARTEARRADVGFIYQFHHLLPEFTALENIVLPQLANGVPAAQAEARARRACWPGSASRRGPTIARRRCRGASSSAWPSAGRWPTAPKLLLADEPTGNLDPETSDQVFDTLMQVVRETGLSALIATHNLALAARMDRTVHLQAGRVV